MADPITPERGRDISARLDQIFDDLDGNDAPPAQPPAMPPVPQAPPPVVKPIRPAVKKVLPKNSVPAETPTPKVTKSQVRASKREAKREEEMFTDVSVPSSRSRRGLKLLLALGTLAALVGFGAWAFTNKAQLIQHGENPTLPGPVESIQAEAPALPTAPPPVGSSENPAMMTNAVRDGDMSFTVSTVTVGEDGEVGRPVIVDLTVTNLGPVPLPLDVLQQSVVDTNGAITAPNPAASVGVPEILEPGQTSGMTLAYDLAPGTNPTAMNLRAVPASPGVFVKFVP